MDPNWIRYHGIAIQDGTMWQVIGNDSTSQDHLALGEVTIGPTYLQSIFTQIRYDRSKGQLSVTLRQNEAD